MAPPIVSVNVAPPPQITPRAEPAPPAPPAPPPPRVSQAAKAKANLASLFSTDDYPQSAIRNEEQGTTAVRLSVGPTAGFRIVRTPPRSSALDTATCNILRRRARFTPAKDRSGNSDFGYDQPRIRWELPGRLILAQQQTHEFK
jgi:protein TonB